MFIIHGVKSDYVSSSVEPDMQCKMCHASSLAVQFHQRYYHVFYLPVFPASQLVHVRCTACGAEDQQCHSGKLVLRNGRPKSTKLKHWIGTLIILFFVLSSYASSFMDRSKQKAYLEKPIIGDLYVMHDSVVAEGGKNQFLYSYYRVKKVTEDSVKLSLGGYGSRSYKDPEAMLNGHSDIFDTKLTVAYSKRELKKMFDRKAIQTIVRK